MRRAASSTTSSRGWVGMSMTYRMRPELPPNAAIGIVDGTDLGARGAGRGA